MPTLRTYQVKVIGCKVNQYEAEQISEYLSGMGLRPVSDGALADLGVVHGCAVTARAEAKSRQAVRRLLRQVRGPVVLSGCASHGVGEEFAELSRTVTLVPEAQNISSVLYSIIAEHGVPNGLGAINSQGSTTRGVDNGCMTTQPNLTVADLNNPIRPLSNHIRPHGERQVKGKIKRQVSVEDGGISTGKAHLGPITGFAGHERAFVKVQDGCDGFCSYCLVPYLRRKVSWRQPEDVVAEVCELVANGYREVVLAGVHLGAYGYPTVMRSRWHVMAEVSLAELLGKVSSVAGLERVRLSSIEPGELSEELLEVMASRSNVAKHLHLPLQSGSGRVLSLMNRQYGPDEFLATVERARSRCGEVSISTDVMVGFPGETDEDFEATMNLARQVGFVRTHVFDFSARSGTAAATMAGQLPKLIRQQRSKQMRELAQRLGRSQQERLIGRRLDVLVEGKALADGTRGGLCEQYFTVVFEAQEDLTGQMVLVLLEEVDQNGARGKFLGIRGRPLAMNEKVTV